MFSTFLLTGVPIVDYSETRRREEEERQRRLRIEEQIEKDKKEKQRVPPRANTVK